MAMKLPPEADCRTSVENNILIAIELRKIRRQERVERVRKQIKDELAEMGVDVAANEVFIDQQIDFMAEAFA